MSARVDEAGNIQKIQAITRLGKLHKYSKTRRETDQGDGRFMNTREKGERLIREMDQLIDNYGIVSSVLC